MHLQRYLEQFGRANVLILIHDDFDRDFLGVLSTLFRFIGVDDSFRPDARTEKVNSFQPPRSLFLAQVLTKMARAVHPHGLHGLVRFGKNLGLKKLVYSDAVPSSDLMTDGQRAELKRYFRDEVRRLSTLLDRDLEALWLD